MQHLTEKIHNLKMIGQNPTTVGSCSGERRPCVFLSGLLQRVSGFYLIEQVCGRLLPETVLRQIQENKGERFEYTIELLQERRMLPLPVIQDLNRIHRYYECMINTMPLSVTQEMCALARRMASYLEKTGKHSFKE